MSKDDLSKKRKFCGSVSSSEMDNNTADSDLQAEIAAIRGEVKSEWSAESLKDEVAAIRGEVHAENKAKEKEQQAVLDEIERLKAAADKRRKEEKL